MFCGGWLPGDRWKDRQLRHAWRHLDRPLAAAQESPSSRRSHLRCQVRRYGVRRLTSRSAASSQRLIRPAHGRIAGSCWIRQPSISLALPPAGQAVCAHRRRERSSRRATSRRRQVCHSTTSRPTTAATWSPMQVFSARPGRPQPSAPSGCSTERGQWIFNMTGDVAKLVNKCHLDDARPDRLADQLVTSVKW